MSALTPQALQRAALIGIPLAGIALTAKACRYRSGGGGAGAGGGSGMGMGGMGSGGLAGGAARIIRI